MIKSRRLLLVPVLLFGVLLAETEVEKLKQQVIKGSPSQVYRALINLQVIAFPTGQMIQKGLEPDELMKWSNYTAATASFIHDEVARKKTSVSYGEYVRSLDLIFIFLVGTLTKLRDKYKLKTAVPVGVFSQELGLYLKDIKVKIEDMLRATNSMIKVSLETIDKKTPVPPVWKDKIAGKGVKDVFPDADTFIADYKAAKLSDEKRKPSVFAGRLAVIKKKDASKFAIENSIGKFDKVIFIEKQKNILKRNKQRLADAKMILADIKKQYPEVLSPLMIEKFGITTDKSSMLILGQAFTLNGALQGLQKELEPFFARV